eukprot:1477001-Alexandrium_andersonii.AAC.1
MGGGAGSDAPVAGPGSGTVVEGRAVHDLDPDYHAPQPTDGGAAWYEAVSYTHLRAHETSAHL